MKPIDNIFVWIEGQNVRGRQFFITEAGQRLRIDICRNSYDFQSHAKVMGFDAVGMKWNEIGRLAQAEMRVLDEKDNGRGVNIPLVSYAARQVTSDVIEAFEKDRDMLVAMAGMLL